MAKRKLLDVLGVQCAKCFARELRYVLLNQCQKYGDLLGWFVARTQNLEIWKFGIFIFPNCTNIFLCFLSFSILSYNVDTLPGSSAPSPLPTTHAPAPDAPVKRLTTSDPCPSAAPALCLSALFASALSASAAPSPSVCGSIRPPAPSLPALCPPASPSDFPASSIRSSVAPSTAFGDQ